MANFFSKESILSIEAEAEYPGWRTYFDGAVNIYGNGIGAVLISKGNFLVATKSSSCTNNV